MPRHHAPRLAPRLRRAAVALIVTALVLLGQRVGHDHPRGAASIATAP
ncbi:MAG: hypothetical protein JNK64_35575 [Myxococcales bacterium]|nr:hypothetical protein [Myxococcales bacterium]